MKKAYLSAITVTNISQSFTYMMAAKSTGIDMEQNYVIVTLYIHTQTMPTVILGIPSPTHSFISPLKTFLFCKSFPLQPFLFFFRTDYMDFPDCLLILLSISVFTF